MSAIPATRTTSRTQSARTRSRARSKTAALVLGRTALFMGLSAMTYLVSSLSGQVMLENARRDGIAAQRRAVEARRSEVMLRSRINELTGFSSLEGWAVAHGFVAPDQPSLPSGDVTRVAKLDR